MGEAIGRLEAALGELRERARGGLGVEVAGDQERPPVVEPTEEAARLLDPGLADSFGSAGRKVCVRNRHDVRPNAHAKPLGNAVVAQGERSEVRRGQPRENRDSFEQAAPAALAGHVRAVRCVRALQQLTCEPLGLSPKRRHFLEADDIGLEAREFMQDEPRAFGPAPSHPVEVQLDYDKLPSGQLDDHRASKFRYYLTAFKPQS